MHFKRSGIPDRGVVLFNAGDEAAGTFFCSMATFSHMSEASQSREFGALNRLFASLLRFSCLRTMISRAVSTWIASSCCRNRRCDPKLYLRSVQNSHRDPCGLKIGCFLLPRFDCRLS